MTHVTCRLTAKNRDQLRDPTLCNRVWAIFTFLPNHILIVDLNLNRHLTLLTSTLNFNSNRNPNAVTLALPNMGADVCDGGFRGSRCVGQMSGVGANVRSRFTVPTVGPSQ